MVHANWEDDEGWTKIYLEWEWKEIIKRADEILLLEDNRSLPHCLMVAVPKKKILLED